MESQTSKNKRVRKFDTAANQGNRYGYFWSDEEDIQLMEELAIGKSMDEIAELHKRTARSIEIHLAKLAAKSCENGMKVFEAASRYRVTETMVNREIKALNRPKKVTKKSLEERIVLLEQRIAGLEAIATSHVESTSDQ